MDANLSANLKAQLNNGCTAQAQNFTPSGIAWAE